MKYLICQEFTNTTNNHAGMKHMCNLLKQKYPNDYEVIIFPDLYQNLSLKKYIRKIQQFYLKYFLIPYKYTKAGKVLKSKLNKNDSVYLLEYCELLFPQLAMAKFLRNNTNGITICGLVHLVPQMLEENFTRSRMQKWFKQVDFIMTFGSSLSNYFIDNQIVPISKVKTIFHYVDLDYYRPQISTNSISSNENYTPKVLAMGNQKRNFELLLRIVKNNPNINFTICQGVMDLSGKFEGCKNVELIGYVDESELLAIMQNSDISLNIMDDTIGSNVITTSMAVGMAMIVSDVGSIREYCKEDGAIYCNNKDINSFSEALVSLNFNQELLNQLKSKSLLYSSRLSISSLNTVL